MKSTESRNPKTTHFSRESTLDMLKIINEENMNSVLATGAALPEIARAVITALGPGTDSTSIPFS